MKKIQPFTIGTKLSVPSESKCPNVVDIIPPVSAADGGKLKSNLNDKMFLCLDHSQTSASDPGLPLVEKLQEDSTDEEGTSVSPTAASRSIRKIAICGNAETENENQNDVSDTPDCVSKDKFSSTPVSVSSEGRTEDSSTAQLEADTWIKKKIKDLNWECRNIPTFSQHQQQQQPEEVLQNEQRDLKDIEYSLIQLTASLDLKQDVPQQTHPATLGLDVLEEKLNAKGHIEKSRMKLRSLLRDYRQDLMLALDVSSFYQLADNIISAIARKRSCLPTLNFQESGKDAEVMEIDSQIRMLNESVSRLSNLHPTLATRVTRKQAEVKESWALLQESLRRNQRADVCSKPLLAPAKEDTDSLTTVTESHCSGEHVICDVMGKDIKEEQNRLRGFEGFEDSQDYKKLNLIEDCSSKSYCLPSESSYTKLDNKTKDWKSNDQITETTRSLHEDSEKSCEMLNDSTTQADKTLSWLRNSVAMVTQEDRTDSKQVWAQDSTKIEDLLDQVEIIWEALRDRHKTNIDTGNGEDHLIGQEAAENSPEFLQTKDLQEDIDTCDSGMLSRFLELLNNENNCEMKTILPKHQDNQDCKSNPPEMFSELDNVTETVRTRGYSLTHHQAIKEIPNLLSTLTLRINRLLSHCAELSMDILDLETDKAVLCDPDLSGLDGLQEQQDDLEVDYEVNKMEVEELERLATHLQALPPEQCAFLQEEVQVILQAWEEVGRSMTENRGRLFKFQELQNYFKNYLAMIAWTEETRSRILSGSQTLNLTENEASELDHSIEQKIEEIDKLTSAGQSLLDDGHQLAETIKERSDELQSMLGWIKVNWELLNQKRAAEWKNVNLQQEGLHLNPEASKNIGTSETGDKSEMGVLRSPLCLKSNMPPSASLGSSICLVLSFDEESPSISQVHRQPSPGNRQEERQCDPSTNQIHLQQSLNSKQDKRQLSPDNSQVQHQEFYITHQVERQQSPNCNQVHREQSPGNNDGQTQQHPDTYQEEWQQSSGLCQMQKPFSSDFSLMQNKQSSNNNQVLTQISPSSSTVQLLQTPCNNQAQNQDLTRRNYQQKLEEEGDSAEATHRVSTYLHVTDFYKMTDKVSESTTPAYSAEKNITDVSTLSPSLSSNLSTSSNCIIPAPQTVLACSKSQMHVPITLNEPMTKQKRNLQMHTTLGLIGLHGLDIATIPSGKTKHRCHTWPIEGRKRKSQIHGELQGYAKKNSLVMGAVRPSESDPIPVLGDGFQKSTDSPCPPLKSVCSYLSLGSTLSFNLPKNFRKYHSPANVSDHCEPQECGPMEINSVFSDSHHKAASTQTCFSVQNQTLLGSELMHPATIHSIPEKTHHLNLSACYELNISNLDRVTNFSSQQTEGGDLPCESTQSDSEILTTHKRIFANTEVLCKENKENTDSQQTKIKTCDGHATELGPYLLDKDHCCLNSPCSITDTARLACNHKCFSVHTKIQDLRSHVYHMCGRAQGLKNSSNSFGIKGSSNGLETSTNSLKTGRVIDCADGDCTVCTGSSVSRFQVESGIQVNAPDGADAFQPDHLQFQEDEEELRDIWNGNALGYRERDDGWENRNICHDYSRTEGTS